MPKFFVFSDVHGFYAELIEALNKAGYDKNNEEHWLISCGDAFDRGTQAKEMLEFLTSTDRLICITGNHEDLFVELCLRMAPFRHDISNGTLSTLEQLSNGYSDYVLAYEKMRPYLINCRNYFETKNYIFVHGWIPTGLDGYKETYVDDWRESSHEEWMDARWTNGMKAAFDGAVVSDKTVVCGHWHTSYGWARKTERSEFGEDACFDIFTGKGIMAIDGCTAYTKKVNIAVIEDDWE